MGARFWYDGANWTIVGLDGAAVRVRTGDRLALLSVTEVMEHAEFDDPDDRTATGDFAGPIHQSGNALFSALTGTAPTPADKRRAEAVNLLLTGYPDGVPNPGVAPHPVYGPQNGQTLEERITQYTYANGGVPRTVERWIANARDHGFESLTDKRRVRAERPLGNCPDALRDALLKVVSAQGNKTKVSDTQMLRQAKAIVIASEGPDFKFPSKASLHRWLGVLKNQYGLHLSKKTQQGNLLRPDRIGESLVVSRPFEVVEIDTQTLDMFALDGMSGQPISVCLTLAIDLFSRSLVAWRFTARDPKGVDAALLVHDMLMPKTWDPEWGPEARWRYGIPEMLVLPGEHRPEAAGVPSGIPSTITLDNGKVYVSDAMKSACQRLGISLQFGRVRRPTDKPHIERVFRTIRNQFIEWLPGYKGPSVSDRGTTQNVEDRASLFIGEIEQLFAHWVATKYQNTPHSGLLVPWMPGKHFTPNEMYDLGIAMTGVIPIVTSPDLAISLLVKASRKVGIAGLEVNSLLYNSPDLDPYRAIKSPFGELKGSWPIRIDPRDISRIWFWAGDYDDPTVGEWIPIPARIRRHVGAFSDIHLAYAKTLFTDADRQKTRTEQVAAVEATMLAMFDRVARHGCANAREERVMTTGAERIKQAAATFPHEIGFEYSDPDTGDDGTPLTDADTGDINFDDIEPFANTGTYSFDDYSDEEVS